MQKNKKQVKQLVKLQKIRVKSNSYDFKRIVLLYGIYGLRALEGIRLNEIQKTHGHHPQETKLQGSRSNHYGLDARSGQGQGHGQVFAPTRQPHEFCVPGFVRGGD